LYKTGEALSINITTNSSMLKTLKILKFPVDEKGTYLQ